MNYLCKSWYKDLDTAINAARQINRENFVTIIPIYGMWKPYGYAVLYYRDIEMKSHDELESDRANLPDDYFIEVHSDGTWKWNIKGED